MPAFTLEVMLTVAKKKRAKRPTQEGVNKMIRTKIERPAGSRSLVLGLLLAMLLSTASLMLATKPAHATTTFTVNLQGDQPDASGSDGNCDTDGDASTGLQCTLRAAIQEANATSGADTINFAIPSLGVKTISPSSELPTITEAVTINGYSQRPCSAGGPAPCSSPNTRAQSTNANLLIELDLANAGGLEIEANNTVVRGLVINNSRGSSISIESGTGNRIEGNFLGTDASGTLDRGNFGFGAQIDGGGNNTIGGNSPDKRNLISGNGFEGIEISDNGTGGNKVQGNLIGTQKDGTSPLGNDDEGVYIDTPNNTIGGRGLGEANVIAFNGRQGVFVEFVGIANTGNRISGNSIFSNGGLGIDLRGGTENATGTTQNDPGDADTGANNLQNFPVITSAEKASGGKTTVKGKLDSTPSTKKKKKKFTIQFFSNPSGEDEGKTFLGQKKVTTNRQGKASFTFETSQPVRANNVTATATDSSGNTSEFSAPRFVESSISGAP
jgi:CSLREA domain-containing protein